jgi:putative transposase
VPKNARKGNGARKNISKPASVAFINQAVVGEAPAPRWLDTDWLLGQFGGERMPAIGAYRQFVLAGKGAPSPLNQVRHQMLLGDDAFVVLHQQSRGRDTLREVSKAQRRLVALNLPVYRGRYPDRAEAMARAYFSGVPHLHLRRNGIKPIKII